MVCNAVDTVAFELMQALPSAFNRVIHMPVHAWVRADLFVTSKVADMLTTHEAALKIAWLHGQNLQLVAAMLQR